MKLKRILGITTVFFAIGISAHLQNGQPARYAEGKKVYTTACLPCHQADGAGVPGLNPPLISSPWVSGDKKKLINVVLKGLNEPIEVDGEEYANPMPAQPNLTDQQIADVLTYVRNSFGNKASVISPAEVKALRGK